MRTGTKTGSSAHKQDSPPDTLTWRDVLAGERQKEYFKKILAFLESERKAGKTIFPKNRDIFNSLNLCPFDMVKVVIIGQDPYHGPNQAHGLCFSVKKNVPPPPSLLNIFKELKDDLAIDVPRYGCLEKWARQGVLLLNAVLTVEAFKPQSHSQIGWQHFTDRVIAELAEKREGLIFLLWGSSAQKKCSHIDTSKHFILKAPHPSPLSAYRGFFGCKHFSKTNQFLKELGHPQIDWSLDD